MPPWIQPWNNLSRPDHPHRQFNHGDSSELGAKPDDVIAAINQIAVSVNSGAAAMQAQLDSVQTTLGPQGPAGPQGSQGPPGAAGATGATGAQGLKGDTGATGAAGTNGTNGAAATVAVGTVSALAVGASPTVVNGGSSSAAILNFGIPAGAKGDTGATGAAGATGATGATGAAGVNAFGAPTAITPTFGTAYQAANPSKPAVITAMIRTAYSISIAGTQADTVELRIGASSADIIAGTGTSKAVGSFEASLTGIAISIGMAQISRNELVAHLPAGWYYGLFRVAGTTATVQSAFDQSVG